MIRYSSDYSGQYHYHRLDIRNAEGKKSTFKVNKGSSYMMCDVCSVLIHGRVEFQILAHLNITASLFLV